MNHSQFSNYKIPLTIALISLALAVILGAFGAHILEAKLSAHYMSIYKTGSFYHFIHSIGWLVVIILAMQLEWSQLKWVNLFFGLGLLLFSGSLYVLSFNEYLNMPGLRKFGAVAPIGGTCFILAWLTTAIKVYKTF